MPSKTERLLEKNSFLLTRGHDFVEIGGVKWATCNIGAEKPTDTGLYFQWGDTRGYTAAQVGNKKGQKSFSWADYKLLESGFLKYNDIDGKLVLDVEDDAAHVNWGGAWRMPTREEFDTLAYGNTVTTFWANDYQDSGVAGLVCIDKTDSSKELFLPAVGGCSLGIVTFINDAGYYLSKSLNMVFRSYCYNLVFNNLSKTPIRTDSGRFRGHTIRGVLDI